MRKAFLALALFGAVLAGGCQLFEPLQSPAAIGCTKAETNECRVLVAAFTIKAANVTIGENLDRGVISVQEAQRLRGITKKAEDALVAVLTVLPLENASTLERIAALEGILFQLLQEQLMKNAGV